MHWLNNLLSFVDKYKNSLFFVGVGIAVGLFLLVLDVLALEVRILNEKTDLLIKIEEIKTDNDNQDKRLDELTKKIEGVLQKNKNTP